MPRIISGSLKGRKLVDSSKFDLRPTTDRNREALFNIISSNFEIKDSNALDLCAGTGSFAIEAISRGAKKAVCIERNRDHVALIRKNLQKLEIEGRVLVKNNDANNLSYLKGEKFDLVFIDPPYLAKIDKILKSLIENDLIDQESLVITETGDKFNTELLKNIDYRKYGISHFGFFKK